LALKNCGLWLSVSEFSCAGESKLLSSKTGTYSVLISVNLRETKLHYLIQNVVCILGFLDAGFAVAVPHVDQGLVPVGELPCLEDLRHPEVHHVEIVVEENMIFITCFKFKVVKALFEVPF